MSEASATFALGTIPGHYEGMIMDRIKKIRNAADHGWSAFIKWGGRINGLFRVTRADLIRAYNAIWEEPDEWKRAMKRGEIRAERVTLIPQTDFNYLLGVAEAAEAESRHYCRPGCNCRICRALYPQEDAQA